MMTLISEEDHSYWFFYDANGNVGQVLDATDPEDLTLAAQSSSPVRSERD